MKKIKISSELTYIFATIILALSVAMIALSGFGLSMIVAPAFLISEKLGFITFGQGEYIIQAILFIILCFAMKKVKLIYFSSFVSGVIYGAVLDLWRMIPFFNTEITPPESLSITVRIALFVLGMLITSFSISLYFKSYLYPQVYDFFVKAVSEKYKVSQSKFKTFFDSSFLIISVVMTFAFFGKIEGINFGTLIMTVFNGAIIGAFNKLLDNYFLFEPTFKKVAKHFEL